MLSSGCDDRKCRVLLPKGVRIGERAACILLGNPDGVSLDGSLHHAHTDDHPCDVSSSLDIPHPEFCPSDVPPSPDVSHPAPDAGWERRRFNFPR